MSESIWLPATIVLGLGLIFGWWLTRGLARRAPAKVSDAERDDLELVRADLETRRDELYARLREEDLDDAERRDLELAAARALRELDQLHDRLPARKAKAPAGEREAAVSTGVPGLRHPFLVGTTFGLGMAALVGVLVYWAVNDAQPVPPDAMGGGAPMQGAQAPPHPGEGELPAEAQARAEQLEQQLASDPRNVAARKELALLQLAHGQFIPAFENATRLLEIHPEDPDGLFVQAEVRLMMGQFDQVIGLFDRILVNFPEHLRARVGRGVAYYQLGRFQEAITDWEEALARVGGQQPELEQMLAEARTAAFERMASGTAPQGADLSPAPPAAEAPAPPVAAAPPAPPPVVAPPALAAVAGVYTLRIELAAGAAAPSGAVLFVSVRGEGGGPPAAVKRIAEPRFPLDLVLSADDSMMGQPLPEAGTIKAQLDLDGNVASQGPGDLVAQSAATLGSALRLVLGE